MSDERACLVRTAGGECGRPVYARGICRLCYESCRRQIATGRRSWEDLVNIGMALPARPRIRNPVTVALREIDEGGR